MEIRQLLTFKRVAELQNYTRAAESLGLTQPAISHQLRMLEEEIGQKLFEFNGRKTMLTTAGRMFVPYADRILSTIQDSKRALENLNEEDRGTVVIAAIGSSTIHVLPDLLYKFRLLHPKITIVLRSEGADEILQLVEQDQVDLGIVGSHVGTAGFATTRLFQDRIGPFVHGDHPMAKKKKVLFAELAREPLIQLGTWRSWNNYVLSLFREVDIVPDIRLHLDSIDAVKRMVERGLGFTILPHIAAKEEVAAGQLAAVIPSDVSLLLRDVILIRRRKKALSKAQECFVEFLEKEVKKLIV
jgi:DNA-binding transcriptional LysR family regulator